uniref:Inactive shikimate kinase like 1, chloroplastic n=2 Tax=Davidia involucrata TaxID=16924 RepID=A0A5B6ZHP8_DAVIN
MEIIHASCSCRCSLLQPLLHLQLPVLGLRFSNSFTTTNFRNHRFYRPLPTPPLSLNPNIPLTSSRKFFTTTHSLPDDPASGSAAKVVDIDPSLAVKKKAIDISPQLKGTSIFLVGINSTMKTSLGKLLSEALRYYYFDSDSLVEEAAGDESAAKSFRERDEEGFRESETEVLKQLSSMGRLVVCAGNGAVQSATNLAFLRHGISIWIDIPLDMIARKVVEDGTQLSASEIFNSGSYSEVMTQLTALYEEMRGGYATADATVSLQKVACELGYDDFDAVTTEDMALEVLKEIEKLTRLKKMMETAARPF